MGPSIDHPPRAKILHASSVQEHIPGLCKSRLPHQYCVDVWQLHEGIGACLQAENHVEDTTLAMILMASEKDVGTSFLSQNSSLCAKA